MGLYVSRAIPGCIGCQSFTLVTRVRIQYGTPLAVPSNYLSNFNNLIFQLDRLRTVFLRSLLSMQDVRCAAHRTLSASGEAGDASDAMRHAAIGA